MAIATFQPPFQLSTWDSSSTRAEALARLLTATVSHALYAKSQLSAPVHALRRGHARTEQNSSNAATSAHPLQQTRGAETRGPRAVPTAFTAGISMARPLSCSGPRAGHHAMRAEVCSVDLFTSTPFDYVHARRILTCDTSAPCYAGSSGKITT